MAHNLRLACFLGTAFLSGCVAAPRIEEGVAELRSSYPIVSINDQPIDSVFKKHIASGAAKVVVKYTTYRYDYFCQFDFMAEPQARYEIVHEEASQPIVMYEWVRRNWLWATLESPRLPHCEKEER